MFKLLCTSLVLAIAAQAYLVESPNGGDGWVANGDNTVTWSRVNTDPTSFDLILSNTNPNEFPQFQEVLVSNVDGLTGSFSFTAKSLPTGSNFRVNLNQAGRGTQGGILAQSNTFTISEDGEDTTTDTGTSTDTEAPTGTVTTLTTTTITESATETVTDSAQVVTETSYTPTITETDVTTITEAAGTETTFIATETETTTFTEIAFGRKARRSASPKWSN